MAFGTKAALHNLCRQKEKEAAMQFFLSNRVPEELERLLNDAARERPKDVFGYLSERLSELSRPPSVARLVADEAAYDSSFDRALVVRLYCTVNGREKLVSEGSTPLVGIPAAAVDEGDSGGPAGASDGRGQDDNDQDQPQHGFDQQQGLIDEKLTQCCREHGGIAMATELAVSMVCARAAEAHGSLPLPYHLARVHVEEPTPLCTPFLVCPVLCSGQGKLRLRCFSVTPLPGVTFPEQVEHLTRFHHALKEKLGLHGEMATPSGHSPPLDRPEQAVELIQEAAARCSLQLGKHLGIVLEAQAAAFFNAEKGKYECVAGQLKTAEEMVAMYVELVQSTTAGIIGICNPFRPEDLASWQKLHREVGGHCYIFSGAAEHLSLLRQQELEPAEGQSDEPFANGTFVQLQPTVSKFCEECQRLQTSPCTVECLLELPERFTALSLELAADLAVATRCRFVRVHYLSGMMADTFVTHLLKRRLELIEHNLHEIQGAHKYTPALSTAVAGEEEPPDPMEQESNVH